ncbi:MAG: hypothetical protein JSR33_08445 [Proteobacteria bacterium]|nr:hypothetical protein [Pseudomonadota bacterium]
MKFILQNPLSAQYVDTIGKALVQYNFKYFEYTASQKVEIVDLISSHNIIFDEKHSNGYHIIEINRKLLEFDFLYSFLPKELQEPLRTAIEQSKKISGLFCPEILGDSKKTSAKLANRALTLIEQQSIPFTSSLSLTSEIDSKLSNSLAVKHFKIWFTQQNTEHPLGWDINEERLIQHQAIFKKLGGTLSLISNYEDFPALKKEKLIKLCKKHDIHLISLTFIFNEICSILNPIDKNIQLQLFYIAMLEINNEYGNLAAASDIIRILDPCIQLGIYSDFDFIITDAIYQAIKTAPLKLNIKFCQRNFFSLTKRESEVEFVENHFLLCDQSHFEFLRIYRNCILESYLDLRDISKCLQKNITHYRAEGIEIFPGLESHLDKIKVRAVHSSCQFSPYMRIFYFRYQLKHFLTNKDYHDYLLISILYMSGPHCITYAFNQYRKHKPIKLDEVALYDCHQAISYKSDCAWLPEGQNEMDNKEKKYKNHPNSISTFQAHQSQFHHTSNETKINGIKQLVKTTLNKLWDENSVKLTSTHLIITIQSIVPRIYITEIDELIKKLQELQYIDQRFKGIPEITSEEIIMKVPLPFIVENPKPVARKSSVQQNTMNIDTPVNRYRTKTIDPVSITLRILVTSNSLFKKMHDEYLEEHRHDDPKLQRAYDREHGLVLYEDRGKFSLK